MILFHRVRRVIAVTAALACGLASTSVGLAAGSTEPDKTRENLMVVVRESVGANKQYESLVPIGKAVAKLPDGALRGWLEDHDAGLVGQAGAGASPGIAALAHDSRAPVGAPLATRWRSALRAFPV